MLQFIAQYMYIQNYFENFSFKYIPLNFIINQDGDHDYTMKILIIWLIISKQYFCVEVLVSNIRKLCDYIMSIACIALQVLKCLEEWVGINPNE